MVDWRLEYAIWNYAFYSGDSPISVDPSETSLILTEAPMSLPTISANTDQMIFEEYGFESYYRCTPGSLVPWNDFDTDLFPSTATTPKSRSTSISTPAVVDSASRSVSPSGGKSSQSPDKHHPLAECALVIDSGFNCTNIMPTILGEVYWPAVQQVSVGGRLLTNYLRETLSFRHYNMMEDTYLVNLIKESSCFVSKDFDKDLDYCYDASQNRRKKKKFKSEPAEPKDTPKQNKTRSLTDWQRRQLEKRVKLGQFNDPPFSVKYVLPENSAELGYILDEGKERDISEYEEEYIKYLDEYGGDDEEVEEYENDKVTVSEPTSGTPNTIIEAKTEAPSTSMFPTTSATRSSVLSSVSNIPDQQILKLSTERFSIPEVLFSPHLVGLDQAGISEAIMTSISKVPQELQSLFLANIVVVGGNSNLPGFVERIRHDLTSMIPSIYDYDVLEKRKFQNDSSYGFSGGKGILRVAKPRSNPDTYSWFGGARLGLQPEMLAKVHVTKQDYMEYGESLCASKFNPKRGGAGISGRPDETDAADSNSNKHRHGIYEEYDEDEEEEDSDGIYY